MWQVANDEVPTDEPSRFKVGVVPTGADKRWYAFCRQCGWCSPNGSWDEAARRRLRHVCRIRMEYDDGK